MKELKQILKFALNKDVCKIALSPDKKPLLVNDQNDQIPTQFDALSEQSLDHLFSFLYPDSKANAVINEPTENYLTISDNTRLRVLAWKSHTPWINIYFPKGEAFFQRDLQTALAEKNNESFTQVESSFIPPLPEAKPFDNFTANIDEDFQIPQTDLAPTEGPAPMHHEAPPTPGHSIDAPPQITKEENINFGIEPQDSLEPSEKEVGKVNVSIPTQSFDTDNVLPIDFDGQGTPQTPTNPPNSEDSGFYMSFIDATPNQDSGAKPPGNSLPINIGGEDDNQAINIGGSGIQLGEVEPKPSEPKKIPIAEEVNELDPKAPAQPQAPASAASIPVVQPELGLRRELGSQNIQVPTSAAKIEFGPEKILKGGDNTKRKIDGVLKQMIELGSSDVHLTVGQPVILRIDGDVKRVSDTPITPEEMEKLLLPIMPQTNQEQFIECNDTDFAYEIEGVGRFRVNMFRDRNGVGAVLRHIPSKILTFEQLNLPESLKKFANLSKGLVVVTGPTGSGKSTTLAAIIDYINKNRKTHIITIEDPIEFVHPQHKALLNQREVHRHTDSFSKALRAALREDPDIVLIGEMRDLETIAIAIETAETGHLVFGTLHTTTAVSTVDRIIDQFPTNQQAQIRMMLSASLKGVVSQTLIKKIGGGRVAAQEVLVVNDAIAANIREGKSHMIENAMATQKSEGNQLLNDVLISLIEEGKIEAIDGYIKCVDKSDFINKTQRRNIKIPGISSGAA